jgi:hypothetical protein
MKITNRIIHLLIPIIFSCATLSAQVSFITNGQQINNLLGYDVQFGDFNNDGTIDAFIVNIGSDSGNGHRVYFNDSTGIFADNGQQLIDTEYTPYNSAVGDINNDGNLEVITGPTIWLNNGNGNFEPDSIKIDLEANGSWGVVDKLEDLNNDGYLDLFCIIGNLNSSIKVYLNDSTGHFRYTNQTFGGGTMIKAVLGDIDSDGDIDAITGGWKSNTVDQTNGTNYCPNRIWINDGNGNFTESGQLLDQGNRHIHDMKLGDISGDGKLDLVMGITSSPYLQIYINDGTGNFSTGESFGNIWVSSFDLGDLNNDESLDLLFVSGDCSVEPSPLPGQVWLNDGTGHFTDSNIRIGNDISSDVKLVDLNNDNTLDAFVVNWGWDGANQVGHPADIWLNKPFECNYLNETKPGKIPVLFGSGIVSVAGENTHAVSFYPDGKSLCFSRYPEGKSYEMSYENISWSNPAELINYGKEISILPGGNRIYYYKADGDIYYRNKTVDGWSNELNVGNAINTAETEFYPSVINDGSLFFSRNGNWNQGHIMYSAISKDNFTSPFDLGLPVNIGGALHAFVSPDKSYMLLNSPRTGSYTELDIWISYRKQNNSWTNPKNLGEIINSGADAILCPTVTPDNKFMFFTKLTFSSNTGNVYWVSTDFIDSMRTTNFIPYLKHPISDKTNYTDETFEFLISSNTFFDDDGDPLSYTATLADNNPLPDWLDFNNETRTFSGISDNPVELDIVVKAKDNDDASVLDTFHLSINGISAINENSKIKPFTLSPNPVNDLLTLIFNQPTGDSIIEIYNLDGKKLITQDIKDKTYVCIDLKGNPNGIYLMKIINNGLIYEEKILKN